MNWSAIFAVVALLASLVSGWFALSMRAERAERRLEMEKMRAGIRADINGSYMRANLVLQIIEGIRGEMRGISEGIHTEIRGIAARISLMEKR